MMATLMLRLHALRASSAIIKGGLTRSVLHSRPVGHLMVNSYATVSSSPAATKAPRKPRVTTSSTTTKKAAVPKKKAAVPEKKKAAAPKKAAPKKKVVKKVVKKLNPWEARDADGKLIPLPSTTKPSLIYQPYLIFFKSRMPALISKPEMLKDGSDKIDIIKVSKAVAAEWKGLSDAEKQPFLDQGVESKKEYDSQIAAWRESLSAEDVRRQNAYLRSKKKDKKTQHGYLRDPSRPKNPKPGFFCFMDEFRSQSHNDKKVTELVQDGAAKWKTMSDSEKQPFLRLAEQHKANYAKEMEAYRANNA